MTPLFAARVGEKCPQRVWRAAEPSCLVEKCCFLPHRVYFCSSTHYFDNRKEFQDSSYSKERTWKGLRLPSMPVKGTSLTGGGCRKGILMYGPEYSPLVSEALPFYAEGLGYIRRKWVRDLLFVDNSPSEWMEDLFIFARKFEGRVPLTHNRSRFPGEE